MEVLYEDNHVIAVRKLTGVPVQAAVPGGPSLQVDVQRFLKERDGKPGNVFLGVVHRLDRAVAGVVVFAKTSKGASRLSEAFRERKVRKDYLAVVEGSMPAHEGELENRITEDTTQDGKRVVVLPKSADAGKPARLRYKVRSIRGPRSLIEIELITGRKHQVRAQFGAAGHPIVDDSLYGASSTNKGAIALVSASLIFPHPVRREDKIEVRLSDPTSLLRDWW